MQMLIYIDSLNADKLSEEEIEIHLGDTRASTQIDTFLDPEEREQLTELLQLAVGRAVQ